MRMLKNLRTLLKIRREFKASPSTQLMSVSWLASLRRDALRRRVWFRILSRVERGVVDLTLRYVDQIRSLRLSLAISRVACKILGAFKSKFLNRVEAFGCDLAEKISKIAVAWGYVEASSWRRDSAFIRFLGVNVVNNRMGWS